MADSKVITATDKTFESTVLNVQLPCLVDFSAVWCGPCRQLAPVFEGVANEFVGKVVFVKIDIDESQATARKFKIMSVPTLMMFKNGEMLDRLTGAVPRSQLVEFINRVL